jgi:hypothetical protein
MTTRPGGEGTDNIYKLTFGPGGNVDRPSTSLSLLLITLSLLIRRIDGLHHLVSCNLPHQCHGIFILVSLPGVTDFASVMEYRFMGQPECNV